MDQRVLDEDERGKPVLGGLGVDALPVAERQEARARLQERRVGVRVRRREAAGVEREREGRPRRGRGDAEHGVEREGVRAGEDAGEDSDGVAEGRGAEGGEVEEEVLGEERVRGLHARAEGARVQLLGGGKGRRGEVEAEERDAVAQRRVRRRRPATGAVEHEARSASVRFRKEKAPACSRQISADDPSWLISFFKSDSTSFERF